jgi:uncharacterized protein YhbP (UPF0306 family)
MSAGGAVVAATPADDLRERIGRYLRSHHTMTLATAGSRPCSAVSNKEPATAGTFVAMPHAASVFYAVDDRLRLIFLSKSTSTHGEHIGRTAPVAITVTEQYDDWERIQGVQLWGTVSRLTGAAKASAMTVYVRRFPFVKESLAQPSLAEALRSVAVYRVEAERVAFTDNTTGVFGREVLDLEG